MKKNLDKLFSSIGNIPNDKVLHFLSGVLIFLYTAYPTLALTGKCWISYIVGMSFVIIIGYLKELRDRSTKLGSCEWKDFVATILGGIISSLTLIFIWSKF